MSDWGYLRATSPYVLEEWSQRLCLKESFAEAGRSLETLLGLKLGTRA